MAIPSAPTNVWCQAGDNLAYLSWTISSEATSYLIQRSTDGVNYSALGSSVVNNYTDAAPGVAIAITGSTLTVGQRYQITTLGTSTLTDWQTIGVVSSTPAVGVIFTAIATGSGSGTATVTPYGNRYYYQVAAMNGSGTSAYTSTDSTNTTLNCIPVGSGQVSLKSLRDQAQQRADRVNSQFVTLPEWNKYVTQSYKELYDLLIAAYGNDYYVKQPYQYATSGTIDPNYNAQVFPLPSDFYKLILCECALNPGDSNSWVTLRQYERIQQNLWNFPNVYTFYGITNLRYRLTGTQLQIVPIASAGQTIRIWYAPRPATLVADTDLVDGLSGWEEYIIDDVAAKALAKEESDVTELLGRKMAMKQRLEEMAANRNIAEPMKVSDSRMRNFAWSDGEGAGGIGLY